MEIALPNVNNCNIVVIGLGYVGLPLAIEFAKSTKSSKTKKNTHYKVIGFDINEERVSELNNAHDKNSEVNIDSLLISKRINFTNQKSFLEEADVFIVTVPTPIDDAKIPDLGPLKEASQLIGETIKKRSFKNKNASIIIFESTVYPGATEEVCDRIIAEFSGLSLNKDYFLGYSPERINPGDKEKKLKTIVKVTSGSNKKISSWIDNLYGNIVDAGTYSASSIKVAEAAKVIENTQRDMNIALVNEIAAICKLLKIDTREVLSAASTKWNFHHYKPGLVGGHCIGVDPYYLFYKAQLLGYHPQMLLSGRKINDGMSKFISEDLILNMVRKEINIVNSEILLVGLAFKENTSDHRNSGAIKVYKHLLCYKANLTVVDTNVDPFEAKKFYDIKVEKEIPNEKTFDAIVFLLNHNSLNHLKIKWNKILKSKSVVYDLTGNLPKNLKAIRL